VVAADVRALTTKIDSATEDMETRVVLVSQTIKDELHAIAELVRGDDDARWVSDIAHALPQLSSDFASSVRELDGFVKTTHDATRTVLDAIVSILGDSQFQDITRQQIDQVKNGLRLCGEHFRRVAEHLDDDWSTPLDVESMVETTAALQAGYTMSAQRMTHQRVVGGSVETDTAGVARIELFH
jgi:chemotaxis regulatin CheY-phosphate phosphatase CheZ